MNKEDKIFIVALLVLSLHIPAHYFGLYSFLGLLP